MLNTIFASTRMQPKEQILYIQPAEILQKLSEGKEQTVGEFFGLTTEQRTFDVIYELLDNMKTFIARRLDQQSACVLFTVMVDVHSFNISQDQMTLQQLSSYASNQLAKYSVEIPPLYKAILTQQQIQICGEFVQQYLLNYKLYRYLFKPVNVIKVQTKHEIDLMQLVNLQQLGHPSEQEAVPAAGGKKPAKPPSAGGSRAGGKPGELPDPPSNKPFNLNLLPLKEAHIYTPPAPKTEQEERQEQIEQEIQDIKDEKKDVQPEEKKEEFNLSVDKFRQVIELQVQQELDKLKTKIQEDLADPKKKK